jgi:hypothetical protein
VIVIDSDDEPDSKDGILPSGAAGERQLSNPTREGPVVRVVFIAIFVP